MPANLGSAYLQVIPSLRGAQSTITKQLGSVAPAVGRGFGTSFVGSFTKALAPLAGIVAGAAGIGAITGFISDSIGAASDLEQSLGGVDAIFGKSASQINKWAKTAQKSAGLSENAYNELANVIGAQLKNSGTAMDKVGEKTNDLIKVGADLAATFGGSTADAVSAISSALKGERDPIERYGVSLTQAAVDAKAAELGFKKVGGVLSTQASQAATLALVYDQTSSATGQFAKQSDTLAEKQQIFQATLENVKAKVGAAFLPAIADMVGALSDSLDPALVAIKPALDAFAGFVGDTAKKASTAFTDLLSGKLLGDTSGFGTALQPVIDKLKQIPPEAGKSFEEIGAALKKALPDMVTFGTKVGPPLVDILSDAVVLSGKLAPAIAALSPVLVPLGTALGALTSLSPVPMLRNLFDLMDSSQAPAQKLQGALTGNYGTFAEWTTKLGLATTTAQAKINAFVAVAQIKFQQFQNNVAAAIGTAVARFQQGVSQFAIRAAVAFGAVVRDAVNFGAGVATAALAAGRALVNNFVAGIRNGIGAVGAAMSEMLNKAKSFLPHSPAKTGPLSGSGWRSVGKAGTALAAQFSGGFDSGMRDFGAGLGNGLPAGLTGAVSRSFSNASGVGGTAVLINNKTNVRLEDLIGVQVTKNDAESQRAQRMGYQALAFG